MSDLTTNEGKLKHYMHPRFQAPTIHVVNNWRALCYFSCPFPSKGKPVLKNKLRTLKARSNKSGTQFYGQIMKHVH
jgi:hypothetical protein